MLKVGLTGGIGSGKSTVSQLFIQSNVKVIDCDIVAREIFLLYPKTLQMIKDTFGEQFFDTKDSLKRRELGNFVFKDAALKKKLEDITLPYIIKEVFKRLEAFEKVGEKLCIVDAPTLIEVGLHKLMDLNIVVWVDTASQFLRVKKRDLISEEQIMNRIEAQMPLDEKRKYADYIIDNSKDLEATKEQFIRVLNKLIEFQGER